MLLGRGRGRGRNFVLKHVFLCLISCSAAGGRDSESVSTIHTCGVHYSSYNLRPTDQNKATGYVARLPLCFAVSFFTGRMPTCLPACLLELSGAAAARQQSVSQLLIAISEVIFYIGFHYCGLLLLPGAGPGTENILIHQSGDESSNWR